MRFYEINTNVLPRIDMLGKETLIPPKEHLSRCLAEYVLYTIVRGTLELSVNGEPMTLLPGDICLFAAGDEQKPVSSGFCEYYYIHFHSDEIRILDMTEEAYARRLSEKQDQMMKTDFYSLKCYEFLNVCIRMKNHIDSPELFSDITETIRKNTLSSDCRFPLRRYDVSSSVSELFLTLESVSVPGSAYRSGNPVKTYETVRKISAFIEEHFAEALTGEGIEHEFFLSFDYCNRIFGKIMGCSIMQYRNMVRIQHAKAEMRTADTSIGDISAAVGFDNTHYFSRIFKKTEGLSPSEYKKKFMQFQTGGDQNPAKSSQHRE